MIETYELCEHDWEENETAETCTESAYKVSICKICAAKETTQTAPALGHLSDGSRVCARCKQTLPVIIGEKYYSDMQTAVNSAAENAIIKLIGNVSIGDTISINKNLTLDLNGFTVTQTGSGGIFVNYGAEVIINKNSIIRKNHASQFAGGGIYMRAQDPQNTIRQM